MPVARRIFLSWLLLLISALVVGGVAIQLLRREQARLAEQGAVALEARRAATAARARLIVENVELLAGDVQTALLDLFAAQPAQGLEGFLDQLERSNPLVRTAFRCTPEGRLLRPAADSPDQEAAGFGRRFARHFGAGMPWAARGEKTESTPTDGLSSPAPARAEPPERKAIASNVAQVQSARRDLQEMVKTREFAAAADAAVAERPLAAAAATLGVASERRPADRQPGEADRSSLRARSLARDAGEAGSAGAMQREVIRTAKVEGGADPRLKDSGVERRGWAPAVIDGRLHLLAWVRPAGANEVRGFELRLATFINRLAGALPAEVAAGEGYALRDEQGRVLHQAGAVSGGAAAAVRIPLAESLLPGWDVAAYLAPVPASPGAGAGFIGLGALLVAIFVAAILAGGSLLLWQARRSEAEAAQKTSFVANVSHEFKTPLTTIRLYAELLEQGRVRDAAQGGEYLRTIGRETQRLARLVNNALDFSRLEQGRKKYAREELDLACELARLLDTQAPRLAEAGLELRRELPAAAVPVVADRDAVEQIVLNLLDNAAKYAASGGELTVSLTAKPRGGAELRVADRGPGVPFAHRERIFEKFHRVDDTLTTERAGAGLGLSIARQLARGLGGDLRYAPRAGGGAEFILELP